MENRARIQQSSNAKGAAREEGADSGSASAYIEEAMLQ